MKNRFNHNKTSNFFLKMVPLILSFVLLERCNGYDPKLETPDPDGHGSILTPLGCLVSGPWKISELDSIYNVSVYLGGKKISSEAAYCSALQKELIFELAQNGTIRYWFKRDQAQAQKDSKGNIEASEIKKTYTKGKWTVDFKDSTLKINFAEDSLKLPHLEGKYLALGSNELALQTTNLFDSVYNGTKTQLIKVTTIYYQH